MKVYCVQSASFTPFTIRLVKHNRYVLHVSFLSTMCCCCLKAYNRRQAGDGGGTGSMVDIHLGVQGSRLTNITALNTTSWFVFLLQ